MFWRGIEGVRHPHHALHVSGIKLHQPLRPDAGHDVGIEVGLDLDDGADQRLGDAVIHLLIGDVLVVAGIARGRDVARGNDVGPPPQRRRLARPRLQPDLPRVANRAHVRELDHAVRALAGPESAGVGGGAMAAPAVRRLDGSVGLPPVVHLGARVARQPQRQGGPHDGKREADPAKHLDFQRNTRLRPPSETARGRHRPPGPVRRRASRACTSGGGLAPS